MYEDDEWWQNHEGDYEYYRYNGGLMEAYGEYEEAPEYKGGVYCDGRYMTPEYAERYMEDCGGEWEFIDGEWVCIDEEGEPAPYLYINTRARKNEKRREKTKEEKKEDLKTYRYCFIGCLQILLCLAVVVFAFVMCMRGILF